MAQMVSWPAFVNDDGSLTTGTIVNEAWDAAVKASIEDQVHNVTYTTVKPKDITGEVEAIKAAKAVGSWTDLKDALDKVIDFTDASLIVPGTIIDEAALQAALGGLNLVMNSTFLIWPEAALPAFWEKVSGADCSRDTTIKKIGKASCKILRSGVDTVYQYDIIDDIAGLATECFQGVTFGFGGHVHCGAASTARIVLNDGVTDTILTHTGSGVWEFLKGTKTFSGAATRLRLRIEGVNNDSAAYFDGLIVWIASVAPLSWMPSPAAYRSLYLPFAGAMAIGDNQGSYLFERPSVIKDIQAGAGVPQDGTPVAPAAGPITIDLVKFNGATYDSLFSAAKDIVADGAFAGSVQPDAASFIHRCFKPISGTTLDYGLMRFDLDAVNGAEGFWFVIRYLQYVNPLEGFLAHDDF